MNKKEMLEMRLNGETYQAIADKAKLSRQRIQQLLSPPKAIRYLIFNRARCICQDCGIKLGSNGHVHHNNSDEENYNELENLVLLCASCHRKRHIDVA